jgi:TRAP-type C4-dicarboxylate transport system permease small subunit
MVVLRYFLGASTIWQTEYVTYSLVAATFIGGPYVALVKGHVNVDLVPLAVGPRGRMRLAIIASVVALLFSVIASVTGLQLWLEAWEGGWRTDTVWSLPLWIPYLPMPIGFGLMALQYLVDILCLLKGDEMPFGIQPEEPR